MKNMVSCKDIPLLKSKNFRTFCTAEILSLIGARIQFGALLSIANKSTTSIGLVMLMQYLPLLVFSVFAGIISDKCNKKTILIFCRIAGALIASVLIALTFFGGIKYYQILGGALLIGSINAIELPTGKSIIPELVHKDGITSAVATFSLLNNVSKFIGWFLAWILMQHFGAEYCLETNLIGLIASIYILRRLKTFCGPVKLELKNHFISDLRLGMHYIRTNKIVFSLLITVAIISLTINNFEVLGLGFTEKILNKNKSSFLLLSSLMGLGSAIGSLFLIIIRNRNNLLGVSILGSSTLCAVSIMCIGITKSYFIAGVLVFSVGLLNSIFYNLVRSSLQINTYSDYRGRVNSLYILSHVGIKSLGFLLIGIIADMKGFTVAFIISGALVILYNMTFYIVKPCRKFIKGGYYGISG